MSLRLHLTAAVLIVCTSLVGLVLLLYATLMPMNRLLFFGIAFTACAVVPYGLLELWIRAAAPPCPRCGDRLLLALSPRWRYVCGRCGFTHEVNTKKGAGP